MVRRVEEMSKSSPGREFLEHRENIMKIPKELRKWIVGMDDLIEMLLVCLLARGHILTEGMVGEGKTMTMDAFARAVGGKNFVFKWNEGEEEFELEAFRRIQFTPDKLPESLVRIVKQRPDGIFEFSPGPLFAHFLLGDEFNRASERTRAPLLEAMEEGRVTIDGKSYILPQPYMVLATINPTDVEGVYRIGTAQSDRFMMKVYTSSESEEEAFEIVRNRLKRKSLDIDEVVTREQILSAQRFIEENIYVSDTLVIRAIKIIFKARKKFNGVDKSDKTRYGPSGKRPYLELIAASQALAFIRGEGKVTPDIMDYLTLPILRHRISLGYVDSDDDVDAQIEDILEEVRHEIAGIQRQE